MIIINTIHRVFFSTSTNRSSAMSKPTCLTCHLSTTCSWATALPSKVFKCKRESYKIHDAHWQRQNSPIAQSLGLVCLWQYFDSCLLSFYDFTKPKGLLQHSDLLRGPIAPTPANPPAPPARPGCSPQRWLLQNAPRIYSLESLSRRKPSFLGLADHKGDVSHFALRLINILVNHLAQANKKRQTEKRKLKEKGK